MATVPKTKYARSGDVHIAYQVGGDGPLDLVLIPGFVSHVEYIWEEPRAARWTETIDSDGEGAAFPYRVHLLDAEGRVSGFYIELQRRRSVEQMLVALRAVLTLDVVDRRPR